MFFQNNVQFSTNPHEKRIKNYNWPKSKRALFFVVKFIEALLNYFTKRGNFQ